MSFWERFPRYALQALEWEPKLLETMDLSAWRAALDLEKVEVLYLFGLGDGSAYRHLQGWLHQEPARRLVFLEEDTGIAAALLRESFFNDPQVDFEILPSGKEGTALMQQLAERYPAKRIEAAMLPGGKRPRFRALRLELLRKTALSHALFVDRMHGYQPFENFLRGAKHLGGAFYANAMQGAFAGIPAIVCGAGPSLKRAIPLLRELGERALIIAGGSAIAALTSQGIEPHFGMAIDPNLEEYRRFYNSFSFEGPLLLSTRVVPTIFRTCNGPFGYMRSGIGGAPELWLEEELGVQDSLIGEHLSEESVSVTAIAIAFAQHIGCNPILLSGIDLAYTGGERYAPGVAEEESKLQEIDAEKSAADRILRRKDKQGRPLYTAVRWLMESRSISHYAKAHPSIRWINTTEGGLSIEGLEEMSLEKASSLYLGKQTDLQGKIAALIAQNPLPKMPPLLELHESLERSVDFLEILAGVKKGSAPLAELELQGELAASVLFYDIHKVLRQAESLSLSKGKWETYLDLSRKYLKISSRILCAHEPIFVELVAQGSDANS